MKIYRIPTNFRDTGYVFNGMIATRNAIDAVAFGIIGYLISCLLPIKGDAQLTIRLTFLGVFAAFGVSGIQGIPVSSYLLDAFSWTRRKQIYLYNHHGQSFSTEAADAILNEPQFGDTLADVLDKVKSSMHKNQMEYIEGETFRFADDPELEYLKFKEEQLKAGETELSPDKETKNDEKAETDKQGEAVLPDDLNLIDITDHIVLHDIREEGDK